MSADIVWADLSMLEPVQAFYVELFDWDFVSETKDMAFYDDVHIAGFSSMPERFRAMKLPSFWMIYIGVPSVAEACEMALDLGGTLELRDKAADLALIRDPLGAGFTLSGPNLGRGHLAPGHGRRRSHALHVSDLGAVLPFYRDLFGWHFEDGVFRDDKGWRVAAGFEESAAQRGGHEYWSVAFGVRDMARALETVKAQGGTVLGPCNSAEGAVSVADPNGAAFVLQPVSAEWQAD